MYSREYIWCCDRYRGYCTLYLYLILVFIAGPLQTSAILHSALHILSLNPSIQNTAYAHISSLTRLPVMSDELSLPYFTALIRELHRFRPVVNLISHAPLEEDVFEDLRVEKGIWVMGNIWSVTHLFWNINIGVILTLGLYVTTRVCTMNQKNLDLRGTSIPLGE